MSEYRHVMTPDTPRTNEEAFDVGGGSCVDADWAREFEREFIEAQKDSARLDRLLRGQHISIDVGPDYTEWPSTREQLDEHLGGCDDE